MSRQIITVSVAVCLSTMTAAVAQQSVPPNPAAKAAEEVPMTRGGVIQKFDGSSPAIGARLPDLKAFDADGREVRLGSLKGQYTVLVFGCLT